MQPERNNQSIDNVLFTQVDVKLSLLILLEHMYAKTSLFISRSDLYLHHTVKSSSSSLVILPSGLRDPPLYVPGDPPSDGSKRRVAPSYSKALVSYQQRNEPLTWAGQSPADLTRHHYPYTLKMHMQCQRKQ